MADSFSTALHEGVHKAKTGVHRNRKEIVDVYRSIDFEEPSDIQFLSFDSIFNGKNTLVVSPTGSGKTEAAIVPLLHRHRDNLPQMGLIYITPLRALNRDMLKRLVRIVGSYGFTIKIRHGDTPA